MISLIYIETLSQQNKPQESQEKTCKRSNKYSHSKKLFIIIVKIQTNIITSKQTKESQKKYMIDENL